MEIFLGTQQRVERAYRAAVAVAENDWSGLDSSRQQLLLLKDLGFRPQEVEAGLRIFDRELNNLEVPQAKAPSRVFLFSGHMIDRPGRVIPRFPASKTEAIARSLAAAIASSLEDFSAQPGDLGICGGACGGDLLFAEACLQRGLSLQVRLPFPEPQCLQESVAFSERRTPIEPKRARRR